MILYIAGNFPQLSKLEREKKFLEDLEKEGRPYNRLISFYYLKESEIVLKLIKEKEEYLEEKVEEPKLKTLKHKGFVI